MKTNAIRRLKRLYSLFPLFFCASISAAPLAWFPGPNIGTPMSGSATVYYNDRNVLSGGDVYEHYGSPFSQPVYLTPTNTSWTYLTPFASLNIAGGAVVNDGNLIVYGGTDGTNSQNIAIAYNFSGDTPPVMPNMNTPRSYLGYAPDRSGNAYAIGGLDAGSNAVASVERLNFGDTTSTWTYVASMPVPRYDFPAASDHTNFIYIFGGYTDKVSGVESASVLRYSVNSNAWAAMAPMPAPVAGSAATFAPDGKFYVVGGTCGGISTNVVQVYDPTANAWTVSTPLPEGLSLSAAGVDSVNRLIVMGGVDTNGNDSGDVWRSQEFGLTDSAPVIVQFPATNAIYLGNYSSFINATSSPPSTYTLVSGPTGMQVNYYSGLITWTPQGGSEIGNIAVTIQATNYAGSTNYTFSITVPPPPPVIPTNFTIIAVNDNSATLSWSAEDPLVGPVTYKIYRVTAANKTRIYTLYATSTTNVVTVSLPTSSVYNFVVTASAGTITTGYSTEIGVVPTAPQPPPNVHLTALTSTSFSLAWNPAPGPAQSANYSAPVSYSIVHYVPYYGGYTLTPVVTGIPTNTTYGTVIGLAPGSGAFWIVQTIDVQGYGSSATANILGITTPVPTAAKMTVTPPAGGTFQFSVTEGGSVLQTVYIQATTNLSDPNSWMQIGAEFPTANPFTFFDTNSSQFPARYYRVISP